jgi:hypothetical protein
LKSKGAALRLALGYPDGMAGDSPLQSSAAHPPHARRAAVVGYWATLGVAMVAFLWGFAKLWNSFFGGGSGGARGALVCLVSLLVMFTAAGVMHYYERTAR